MAGGGAWAPNERFLEEVRRFAEFSKTSEFVDGEVGYKLAAAAIIRRVVPPSAIAQPGGPIRFADAMSGTLESAGIEVSEQEREYLNRFNYSSSLYNMLGAGPGASVQRGALAGWARNSSEQHVREAMENLFDDRTPLARRVDDFREVINREYDRIHAAGLLKSAQKPTLSTPMVALLLGLADPSRYTLYRADINLQAAADFAYAADLSAGTAGEKYERIIHMQRAFADAMQASGCEVPDLLRVHDFLWVRSKYPEWGGDRWASADFDAMDASGSGDQSKQAVMNAVDKLKRVGRALHAHVSAQVPDRRFRLDTFGLYPPSRTSWSWVLASVNEAGAGQPTAWPQLNVELRAEGLDVFFSFDLAKAASVSELSTAVQRASSLRAAGDGWSAAAQAGYADWDPASSDRLMIRKRFPADEVVTWPNFGIDRLRQELELLLSPYLSVLPDASAAPAPSEFPPGVDLALLDASAERERIDPDRTFDLHVVASAQLRNWLERRAELSEAEFIAGLKERFLRFGRVFLDGNDSGAQGLISMSRQHAEDALASGRLTVDGNQHWTNLSRSAGHGIKEPAKLRAAIDYLLDESRPFAERIDGLTEGEYRVKGFGPAHWTGMYAMATGWGEANYNQTVVDAFMRLNWPLGSGTYGEITEEITRRGRLIMERTGLDSLWTVDRVYWRILQMNVPAEEPSRTLAETFRAAVAADGLRFADEVIDSVYLALRTKPFLILTGLSGTGKTKIAMTLADVVCDPGTTAFVSVRPDWTDSKGLLGFHNLLTDKYQTTPALELLLNADEEWRAHRTAARPYLLILDEMNLARVEHYFADFLSAFESRRLADDGTVTGESINLHDRPEVPSSGEDREVPGSVKIPPNFYVVGTVNVDETTHPFSRKVLDRANTVELFDVDLTNAPIEGAVRPSPVEAAALREHFTRAGQFIDLHAPSLNNTPIHELVRVNGALERRRLHFGYRVRNEILQFVAQAADEGFLAGSDAPTTALDVQLVLKVLPKLSGSRERLEKPLRDLLALCFTAEGEGWVAAIPPDRYEEFFLHLGVLRRETETEPQATAEAPDTDARETEAEDVGPAKRSVKDLRPQDLKYPRTARKIARMLVQLHEEGYASFFE